MQVERLFASLSTPKTRVQTRTHTIPAMRMERLSLYVLFAVAIQSLCCADVTKLSTDDRKALQDSERFREIHSTSDLPRPIVALCGGKLAEPGGKWNPTDSIIDPTLPGKRAHLGSNRRRLLRCAVRARRNRAHVSCVGCETGEGRTESENSLARNGRSV